MSKPLPWNVRLLAITSLLNDVASEIVAPLLPEFLTTVLGGNRTHLGLIDGVGDTVGSLLKLWSGGKSDQVGRRKSFIVFGYALAGLARPLMGLAFSPWHLITLRAVDRFGKGVRQAPRDALIAESTPREQHGRAFGFNRAMDHLGAAIGPLIAFGFLWLWPGELRWLFLLTLPPAVVIVTLLVFGLKEEAKPPKERQRFIWSLAPFPVSFRWYLLALLVFTLGNSSDSFLLVRAKELGVPTVWLPILWLVFHVAKSAGSMAGGRAVDWVGTRPLILAGWFVYAIVYLAFGLATQAWHAWLLFLAYAAFFSLTESAEKTLVAQLVGGERKGLAFGWFNLTIGVAALPANIVFGRVYDLYGPLAAFGMGAGLAAIAALLLAPIGGVRLAREDAPGG